MPNLVLRAAVAACFAGLSFSSIAQTKNQIKGADDLPRFVYPIKGTASQLLESDAAKFEAFATPVDGDLASILANYEIADKATMRELLNTQMSMQELAGQYEAALKTVDAERALEEKPAAKLLSGIFMKARLQAMLDTHSHSGPEYVASFKKTYKAAVDALPWDVVQDSVKAQYSSSVLTGNPAIIGMVQTMLDPIAKKSAKLDNKSAWTLIEMRDFIDYALPLSQARAEVLRDYIAQHNTPQPDIWPARELVLTAAQKLTPVNVAIWDSGIDVAIFPDQLFNDPNPTASGTHGLAFSDKGFPEKTWTHPLTPAQQAEYPLMLSDIQGRLDVGDGVESKEAKQLEEEQSKSTAAELHRRDELDQALGHYLHGTHCAGIAVRNNPYARLVVARFNDDLPQLEFPPTTEWAERMAGDFKQMSDYFNSRHVRVVNMSWGDDVSEFEDWLSHTGSGGKDAATRKAKAEQLYGLWRKAVESTIRNSPDTLFITAAGNSDSDASFLGDVPSSLHLPNLITVGAVNQAGTETSFTSSGETVLVHANGYHVESFVPGGTRAKLSGTSMASPNVVNLAAKLFALDPTLTPAQVIKLIRDGADASADGRIHLINPKHSAELLKSKDTAMLDKGAPSSN
jgi:subtilisin family serine protease